MQEVVNLDSNNCSLHSVSLIEASAGTGKTYTIQNLVLRLICEDENRLDISSILVMTFTNAATEELKDRIRAIFSLASAFMEKVLDNEIVEYDKLSEEEQRIFNLLKTARNQNGDEAVLSRINNALLDFDNAAIFTIHGFCQRLLSEFAFESGILFNTEIGKTDISIIDSLINDEVLSLKYRNGGNDKVAEFCVENSFPEDDMRKKIKNLVVNENRKAFYQENDTTIDNYETKCLEVATNAVSEVSTISSPFTIEEFLDYAWTKGKVKGKYDSPEGKEQLKKILIDRDISKSNLSWARDLGDAFGGRMSNTEGEFWKQSIKPILATIPQNIDLLKDDIKQNLLLMIVENVKRKFRLKKLQENFQTFDDLGPKLLKALDNKIFLKKVQEKLKIGIIDEFQDTDPIQYGIARKIFIESPNPRLFMVGDPKQAIYAFRGGDIFTYEKAKKECIEHYQQLVCLGKNPPPACYNLPKNFRSNPKLIKCINALFTPNETGIVESKNDDGKEIPFSSHHNAFCNQNIENKNIDFIPVTAGAKGELLNPNGTPVEDPLKVVLLHGVTSKTALANVTPASCAKHIAQLLHDKYLIKEKEDKAPRLVKPSDFAILVTKKKYFAPLQRELNKLNIPSCIKDSGNVFSSEAAEELIVILDAIVDCTNRAKMVEAMLTKVLGLSFSDIDEKIELFQTKFNELIKLWESKSFISMFYLLLKDFNIREKLLLLIDGERQLTDLLHLKDLLHTASLEKRLSPSGLLDYLRQMKEESDSNDDDTHKRIMETERSSVTLCTAHASKGLEYPIVMLPFMFDTAWDKADLYHDDLGTMGEDVLSNDVKEVAKVERLQELMRLFYVAVTRAKYSCYIYWSDELRDITSLDWIFSKRSKQVSDNKEQDSQSSNKVYSLVERVNGNRKTSIPTSWLYEDIEEISPYIPEKSQDVELVDEASLQVELKVNHLYRFASFSSISPSKVAISDTNSSVSNFEDNGLDHDDENNDESSLGQNQNKKTNLPDTFKLPIGAGVGNAWHEILEHAHKNILEDKSIDHEKMDSLIARCLEKHMVTKYTDEEVTKEYCQITKNMVDDILNVPLTFPGSSTFTLADVKVNSRQHEQAFLFEFKNKFGTAQLRDIIKEYSKKHFDIEEDPTGNISLDGGFLNGFIDLVFQHNNKFYIIDWKSNSIHGNMENFDRVGLSREIVTKSYHVQYILYTVALTRQLQAALSNGNREYKITKEEYDKYFGGVAYLFLRGIKKEDSQTGIFIDRPSFEEISLINNLFGE